jgi:hypothetical protein
VFEQTCDKPYDRHDYELVLKDGRTIVFEDYEMMRAAWFQNSALKQLSHVNVLDVNKGFK